MNKTFKDFKEKENLLFDHTVWLMTAMDVTAEHLHGEFGYDTCSTGEKKAVIELLLHNLNK